VLKALRNLVKQEKKLLRKRRSDRRRSVLIRAGRHLLTNKDCDKVAVGKIASRAGCSVGAFYGRFPHKGAFLNEVIVTTFDSAMWIANRELDPSRWRSASAPEVVRRIVKHVVTTMSGETAGVMRTALKRALAVPSVLEPVLSYRVAVTDRAVAVLVDRLTRATEPEKSIRIAMQTVHATVMDALLHDRGPLRSGSHRMIDGLSHMMMRLLELRIGTRNAEDLDGESGRKSAALAVQPKSARHHIL
jgi:AcrR family transcriptional regulator